MNALANTHLTDDALDDLLLDLASPEASDHVAACSRCAQRLQLARASLLGPVTLFNDATLAWSEARSNTLTRDLSGHRPRPALTLPALASYAAAALFAASIMLTAGLHHRALSLEAIDQPAAAGQPSASDGADEIADDNAMLHAIDSELYRPVAIPAAVAEDPQAHLQRHAGQVSN